MERGIKPRGAHLLWKEALLPLPIPGLESGSHIVKGPCRGTAALEHGAVLCAENQECLHGGSSCRDFTFGSWQVVGARQEAEELQTHSAPRCWQLLPGSELVKCSFIGLPFPTGSGQEALEGQVAFPILSLSPLGALWDGGQGVCVSPPVAGVPSVLNTDYPWQRKGSKAEAAASGLMFFSGLGRVACFQGSQGAAPGEMEQSLPGEHKVGEQGMAGWRDTAPGKN